MLLVRLTCEHHCRAKPGLECLTELLGGQRSREVVIAGRTPNVAPSAYQARRKMSISVSQLTLTFACESHLTMNLAELLPVRVNCLT
jgi:hypothetical protein